MSVERLVRAVEAADADVRDHVGVRLEIARIRWCQCTLVHQRCHATCLQKEFLQNCHFSRKILAALPPTQMSAHSLKFLEIFACS